MIDIAIIDDEMGLQCYRDYNVKRINIAETSDSYVKSRYDTTLSLSHSSVIVRLLLSYLKNIKISLTHCNIFTSVQDFADERNLEKALAFCQEKHFDIILLSCGSIRPEFGQRLIPLIDGITKQNTILVTTLNNRYTLTFPGCFRNVICVEYNEEIGGINAYKNNFLGVDFAVGFSRDYLSILDSMNQPPSNSYAVPIFVSAFLNHLSLNKELSSLYDGFFSWVNSFNNRLTYPYRFSDVNNLASKLIVYVNLDSTLFDFKFVDSVSAFLTSKCEFISYCIFKTCSTEKLVFEKCSILQTCFSLGDVLSNIECDIVFTNILNDLVDIRVEDVSGGKLSISNNRCPTVKCIMSRNASVSEIAERILEINEALQRGR